MKTNSIYTTYNQQPIMYKNIIMSALLALLLVACGGASVDKNKAELDKLKKEREAIDKKITALEELIAKTDTTKKDAATDVVVMPIQPSIFKSYIEVQGRVDADESVNLSSEMPGTITKIYVRAGERVSKGQVLAETDARAQAQQLAAMQTTLSLVNQMYEKQKNLWEQKIGTEIQYLQTKAAKEGLESSMAALQEQIRMSKIISPIDGTVDMVNVKVGQAVAPGMGVISVVNFSNMKIKAEVAESYASRIKNNAEVLVILPDMNDTITSTVTYASRAINLMTRTFGVEVNLQGGKEYHPNTVAKLSINDYASPTPVIVVPVKLIQKGNNESFAMVVEKGKAVKRLVQIGREYNGMAEIVTGLAAGEQLITMGYDMVNEGDAVNIVK